ncbi:D-serine deaminase-like pyridoxal phosphate-dependent protein [Zhongshania antarctica]|uniref:D-serine deaminase-like pyridoxal phosphate-dependent protein n=1 Tax=Zhongshania antarctica TaxID=641702 RepID=A0A840R129_9GAMM|nr:D-serine deaminase-like pyridoxal phosphate-dependent protein [Zhongshania antarctica]
MHGPKRSVMVIDLDRFDQNLDLVKSSLKQAEKHYRFCWALARIFGPS